MYVLRTRLSEVPAAVIAALLLAMRSTCKMQIQNLMNRAFFSALKMENVWQGWLVAVSLASGTISYLEPDPSPDWFLHPNPQHPGSLSEDHDIGIDSLPLIKSSVRFQSATHYLAVLVQYVYNSDHHLITMLKTTRLRGLHTRHLADVPDRTSTPQYSPTPQRICGM